MVRGTPNEMCKDCLKIFTNKECSRESLEDCFRSYCSFLPDICSSSRSYIKSVLHCSEIRGLKLQRFQAYILKCHSNIL